MIRARLGIAGMAIGLSAVVASASLPGDVNGDGSVSSADTALLQFIVANMELFSDAAIAQYEQVADLNGDGALSVADVVLLAQAAAAGEQPADIERPGDFNGDGSVDADDRELLFAVVLGGAPADSAFDLNGDGVINVQDVLFFGGLVDPQQPAILLPGDLSGSLRIDIADVILAINAVVFGDADGSAAATADLNGDGLLDISDVVTLAQWAAAGFTPGDVDGDGTATAADVALLLESIAGLGPDAGIAGDVNLDGEATVADVLLLIKAVGGA